MKPIIGITLHVALEASHGRLEVQYRTAGQYAAAIRRAGAIPLLMPTHPDYAAPPEEALLGLDGLLLSGGGGNHQSYFQDEASPTLRDTNAHRYDYEVELVREAHWRAVPMLGICRGFQTMAEALGGTLVNDLRRQPAGLAHSQDQPPFIPTHELAIELRTHLYQMLGASTKVNSFHGQGVAAPPPDFNASAWAADGLIEAIEAKGGFAVGVQFHPEWLLDVHPGFLGLFAKLVEQAARHARKRRSF